jgi:HD-GYP domain-containing protein (c-di-GMP phosphodiesterase class II)
MFSFKKKLASKGVELLEAISDVLAVALDKLMLKLQLREQYLCTIKSLVVAIEAKDLYTQGHSQRVASYSRIIGQHLNMKENELDELEITGLVHDVGKIGVSDNLLTKADSLTDIEFDEIRKHPQIGLKILMPLGVSENVMMGTLLHHKRYDLKGYPCNMKIDKLPLVPAIIGVADAFDAMTTERTYKKRISKKAALQELQKYSGTQFDPKIVNIMLELVKEKII